MTLGIVTGIFYISLLIAMATGLPVAFALGGLAVAFVLLLWDPAGLAIFAAQAIGVMDSWILLAGPLFTFTAMVLERSGIADALYQTMYLWIGRLRGGLAIGTVLICTLFAAMVGIVGAATITMGLIALPSMLKRGYDKRIAIGCISAGGALGQLIPPSILMLIYALVTNQSVGVLYAAGVFPGLMLAALYIIYIFVRCRIQPELAPALKAEETPTWTERFRSLRAIILPIALILMVLGTLFAGICTATESAAIGAIGSVICAAIYRRLNWQLIREACHRTFYFIGMVTLIIIASSCFSTVYDAVGAKDFVEQVIVGLPLGRWGILIMMQVSFFIMGTFLDDIPILMICAPIYVPIIKVLGFDPNWFALLFVINMQMAYLTPPFGFVLFYMKAVVPKGITMGDVYQSIWPFVCLQGLGLVLCMIFPQIILWLPTLLFAK